MATEGGSVSVKRTMVAGADLSAAQFLFVKDNGSGKAVLAAAATDDVVGVLQNNPKSGGACEIVVTGFTKVIAVGVIAPGGRLGTDNAGKAQAVALTGTGGAYVQGTKLAVGIHRGVANSAASDKISAIVNCLSPLAGT